MALALDDSSADATYFRAQACSRTGNIWSAEADWHRCLLLARLQENEALAVMTEQVTHRPVSTSLLCLNGILSDVLTWSERVSAPLPPAATAAAVLAAG